jgi:hypothetical protein
MLLDLHDDIIQYVCRLCDFETRMKLRIVCRECHCKCGKINTLRLERQMSRTPTHRGECIVHGCADNALNRFMWVRRLRNVDDNKMHVIHRTVVPYCASHFFIHMRLNEDDLLMGVVLANEYYALCLTF